MADSSNDTDISSASTLLLPQTNLCNSFDVEKTICDNLNGAFFTTLHGQSTTTVDFHFPAVFNLFLDLLSKEYSGQTDTEKSNFTVTCHINSKSVHLTISKEDRALKISGPGQKLWLEQQFFKRIARNLYRVLINDLSSNDVDNVDPVNPVENGVLHASTPAGSHARPRFCETPVSPVTPGHPVTLGNPVTDSGPQAVQQMTSIIGLIQYHNHQIESLRNDLMSLTNEVKHLREQQVPRHSSQRTDSNMVQNYSSVVQISSDSTQAPSVFLPVNDAKSQPTNSEQPNSLNQKKTMPTAPQHSRKSTTSSPVTNHNSRPRKTLIIGDSLIKGINEKGLRDGVVCYGLSGAGIDDICKRIEMFNLIEFATVIVSVGGNDVANKTDLEYFEEKLDQLFTTIKSGNALCKLIVCGICPRSDCDVTSFNDVIHELALEHTVQSVFMDESLCMNGHQVDRYFSRDGIHFSPSGVRRFLDTIEKSGNLRLVDSFSKCAFVQRNRHSFSQNSRRVRNGAHENTRKCFKCGETNHTTSWCRHRNRIRCHDCGSLGHKKSRCHKD